MKQKPKRRLSLIKRWLTKQYRKNRNTYIVKDSVSNQYIDMIYAKNSEKVMKIFSRRLSRGKRGLYKRSTGNGVIIENKDWNKPLKE